MKHANATTEAIMDTIDSMRPALKNLDSNTIHMSCLALAIIMQKPSINLPDMIEMVKGTSEYIHLALEPTTGSVN